MKVWESAVVIIVLVSFFGSITAMLFFAGSNFPERTAQVSPEDTFDTSFWNLTEAYTRPLDILNQSLVTTPIENQNSTTVLEEWYFDYSSEVFRGNEVRISSVIITDSNNTDSAPAILYLHGYGERYLDYIQILREFASTGFVVMGIDQPGSGASTGYPELSAFTFLNVSNGPQDSSLFHSVWAAARAITLLESLSYVQKNATIVAGNSMGGLVTFILSGIDRRVDASIPMISAGNFRNSLTSGSLLNTVIAPNYYMNSDEMNNIIKWFDPLAYARLLTKPIFLLFGTDDQFFPLISYMDTIQAINVDLTLNIVPNWGHGVLYSWVPAITKWIDRIFRNGEALPEIGVTYHNEVSLQGSTIKVDVSANNVESIFLCWRSSEPGAVWFFTQLPEGTGDKADSFTGAITPLKIGRVLFFVVAIQDDGVKISSRLFISNAGSFLFPFLLVISSFCIILIIHYNLWKPNRIHLFQEIPYIFGMITLSAGFLLPLYTIYGRTSLSAMGFLELYGETFFLGGWFLPTIFTGLCIVLALSAFRHKFEFRYAISIWIPLLAVTIIIYVVFRGIFAYFGNIFLIDTGIGAMPLLGAIPLMQLLDRYLRNRRSLRNT